MKKNILFFSDCPFFAGCENMLVNFFNNKNFLDSYNVEFMYRWTLKYELGLKKRVESKIDTKPLKLFNHYDLYDLADLIPVKIIGKGLKFLVNLLLIKYIYLFLNCLILARVLNKRTVDILHINNGGYPGAYSTLSLVFAARFCGIRHIVYVVNNIAEGYRSPERWGDYLFDRAVIRIVTRFVTGSQYAGKELIKTLNVPSEKVVCIHNGVARRQVTETREQVIRRLGIRDDRLVFSVIAVIEERKGHIYLLKALKQFKVMSPMLPVPFCIIEGTGPCEEQLKRYVENQGLSDDVLFISHEETVFNLVNASDCIILPSIKNEDFPNIILESMSLGKAIIASNFSGIPEQIEHMKSGILVEPKDIRGLADAIQIMINNPELIVKLGENAKIRFDELFTVNKGIHDYCQLYENIIEEIHV